MSFSTEIHTYQDDTGKIMMGSVQLSNVHPAGTVLPFSSTACNVCTLNENRRSCAYVLEVLCTL